MFTLRLVSATMESDGECLYLLTIPTDGHTENKIISAHVGCSKKIIMQQSEKNNGVRFCSVGVRNTRDGGGLQWLICGGGWLLDCWRCHV